MEEYLKVHQVAIGTFLDQLKHKLIDVPEIESKLPRSFLQLHEVITKILKDNGIAVTQEESKTEKVDHL